MALSSSNLLYLVFLLVFFDCLIGSISDNQTETGFNTTELVHKLRARLQTKVMPTSPIYNFTNDDLYILKWLKANTFNLNVAEAHFMDHLTWRRNHKIDLVLHEDWSQVSSEFPMFTDTVDRTGRPCAEVWLSDWNIRRAVITGRGPQLIRWHIHRFETQQKRLFETRGNGNMDVIGTAEIQDFQGFNAWQQGCPACLSILRLILQIYYIWEKHYGGIIESVYLVNLNPAFYNVVKLTGRQFATVPDSLKLYQNKRDWLPVLDSVIDRDQRSVRFGGNIQRKAIPLI